MTPFPKDNFVGKSKIDRNLMESQQWQAAKGSSDIEAAQTIVSKLWSDKKEEELKDFLKDRKDVLLISQPSTSRTNVIPIAFVNQLNKSLGVSFAIGDEHFKVAHRKEVKQMSSSERTFERRIYVPYDEKGINRLVSGKNLVVVDDLLTSGGSAAEFIRTLEKSGGKAVSVVALMGDKRLNVDQLTRKRLGAALENKGITVATDELSNIITRSQAGRMIQLVNNVRTDNGKQKITRNIQGLLDQGTSKNLGRDTDTQRYGSINRNDRGDERIFESVKAWAVQRPGQAQRELKNRFLSKEEMAQANWPPFLREEQGHLMDKFNAGGTERVRFSNNNEAVQGEYLGAFDYQGVKVGAIQEGRERGVSMALVPFKNELSAYINRDVRYDIGKDQVSDRLQEQFKMVMTEKGTGATFSKIVTVETGSKKTVEEQKKDFTDNMQKQLKLSSSKYDITFEKLNREQVRKMQLDQSLSQGMKI